MKGYKPKEENVFTILLVDDRAENLIALEEMLAKKGRRFITANSGNEALKISLKNDIGLVLLDVQMPDMDGFEVARLLKSNVRTRDVAVIFVTAINKDEQYVIQGFEEGAVDYLQKPLNIDITRAKVSVFEKLFLYQQELQNSLKKIETINGQLERFVSIVSHDLKSPLASIVTILSAIKNDEAIHANIALREKMDMIDLSATHMNDMIASILAYSKQSYLEQTTEEVDTHELVSQVIFLLFAPPHISFTIQEDMPILFTRRQKLQQVFQNLIGNCIRFMDKQEGKIEIGCTDYAMGYRFFVRDNGAGIAKDDQQRIFNMFQVGNQSDCSSDSSGIGLNIVKTIVEEQGGKTWVESNPGVGSTFYFEWLK